MIKLMLALAVLGMAVTAFGQGETSGAVALTGASAALNGIGNTPTLIMPAASNARIWGEVVHNHGTNAIIVDYYPGPTLVVSNSKTNWSGTILLPGGSFTSRPFGQQINAPSAAVYGVVIGTGDVVAGWRQTTR